MALTKRESKQLLALHRKAMKACEAYYQSASFSGDRADAMHAADADFLRAVTAMTDAKPVTVVNPLMASDLLPKRRK
jgi:hypothetical protein